MTQDFGAGLPGRNVAVPPSNEAKLAAALLCCRESSGGNAGQSCHQSGRNRPTDAVFRGMCVFGFWQLLVRCCCCSSIAVSSRVSLIFFHFVFSKYLAWREEVYVDTIRSPHCRAALGVTYWKHRNGSGL